MKKSDHKINIDDIDLDRMGEMTTESPGLIDFPHTVGSAMIKPEDRGKIKGRALTAMHEQTEMQMQQIYRQMQLLAEQANAIKKRVAISERIYQARMGFEPLIGQVYHLYAWKNGEDTLSLIAPGEWNRSKPFERYVASVKLLADHTWEVIHEGSDA